jgi:protein TonB
MRTCTITLSVVAHALAVCAAFIAPLLATDELPSPRTATEFIQVVQLPEPPPPAPRASTRANAALPPTDAAPLEAPHGIAPESRIALPDERVANDNGIIGFGGTFALADEAPPPSPPPSPPPMLRVGGSIRPPQKIFDVAPVYPPIAMAARKEGLVILEAVIAEDGSVRDARVLRSVPLLDAAALEAVRQWRFIPTVLNGQAVAVVMTVTVAFQLR